MSSHQSRRTAWGCNQLFLGNVERVGGAWGSFSECSRVKVRGHTDLAMGLVCALCLVGGEREPAGPRPGQGHRVGDDDGDRRGQHAAHCADGWCGTRLPSWLHAAEEQRRSVVGTGKQARQPELGPSESRCGCQRSLIMFMGRRWRVYVCCWHTGGPWPVGVGARGPDRALRDRRLGGHVAVLLHRRRRAGHCLLLHGQVGPAGRQTRCYIAARVDLKFTPSKFISCRSSTISLRRWMSC